MAKENFCRFAKMTLPENPEAVETLAGGMALFVDRLTDPRKVAAFFDREKISGGELFLMFVPFLFTQDNGAELIKDYGKKAKKRS